MTSSPARARRPGAKEVELAGEALLRLGMRLYRLELEALDSLSIPLSIRQYHILDRVDRRITSMTELAALAHRQPPTISRSVDSLVRQGLLARSTSTSDRRVAALSTTPTGLTVLEEARHALRALSTSVAESFDAAIGPLDLAAAVDSFYESTERQIRSVAGRGAHAHRAGPIGPVP